MDILSNLKYSKGSRKNRKRVGRGEGSGHGKTSTRGSNGQMSRSGANHKAWFEGGQMPLQRRLPKFGFNNINRVEYKAINISTIAQIGEKLNVEVLTIDSLIEAGLVSKNQRVKILGVGELTKKIDITAHAFSKTAIAKIEALQGKATII